MSDEFEKSGDFSETTEPGNEKPKGKAGIKAILGILKWVGIGLGAVIFIVAIVIITVTMMNKQSKPITEVPVGESYQAATPKWATFTAIDQITATTIDKEPYAVMVKLNLAYDSNNKEIQTELTARKYQIQDTLRNFFSRKTREELLPNQEKNLKSELRQTLNNLLENRDGVKDIYFQTFSLNQL